MNLDNGLTIDGCRGRQQRLREALARESLDAALLVDRRHVQYLTGYWCRELFQPLAWLPVDGPMVLVAPLPLANESAAVDVLTYPSCVHGTVADHQLDLACRALESRIVAGSRVGCDGAIPHRLLNAASWHDIVPTLLALRRAKDPDEIHILRRAIAGTEAAYRYARETLEPGVLEVDLFAGMQAAAASEVGETIGEFGNDFQIGALGSAPRRRPAQTGEMAILDVSVVVRGYASDMCHSLVVGRRPTEFQQRAHDRLVAVMRYLETALVPGASCREIDRQAKQMLADFGAAVFTHHLGHGVGLCNHEGPRLDASSNDTLAIGDVVAVEPGLYDSELRAGLRIENMYQLGADALVPLSDIPTDLV